MQYIHELYEKPAMKERVLMFGEGNFLRAFIGRILAACNERAFYAGSIVALQGLPGGMGGKINAQNGLFTLVERGVVNGEVRQDCKIIDTISRVIDPFSDYRAFLETAGNADLRVVTSNTTEFGICYDEKESASRPHHNFPAKLTDWLYERFVRLGAGHGVLVLPCELIDRNAETLLSHVLRYAQEWDLGEAFTTWLKEECRFCNTLVDRVVSGYPAQEGERMCGEWGYRDDLIDVCEPFLLWVIDSAGSLDEYLPLSQCGLNIVVTKEFDSYRTRKVRILNGAHTSSVAAGYLCGIRTVDALVADPVFEKFLFSAVRKEIIPSFRGNDLEEYANDVFERFRNPYLNHQLSSILLNSISKFRARILPSILDCVKQGIRPRRLYFSLAALLRFYEEEMHGIVKDDAALLVRLESRFKSGTSREETLRNILADEVLWGCDLTKVGDLYAGVCQSDALICERGVYGALQALEERQ